ncbi:MAG: DUF3857 domain-containing protein [Flavisolibacter sp.]
MRTILLLLILLTANLLSYAGDIRYPVSSIPEKLLKNAHVVKRMEDFQFRINGTGETVLYHKYALTVLDEKGDGYANLVEYYDKLQQVRSIEGSLYNALGLPIRKLKSKEIEDLSAVDDNNLMDDSRRKVHSFYYRVYPYTVEYEVETKFSNTLFFPSWVPQEGEYFSVEQSSYTITCPADYQVRYRSFNYQGEPVVTTDKDKKIMRWEVKNLPGFAMPFACPSWREITTTVYLAPTEFEIQGFKGNMNSWKELGKFQYALNAERDQLPEKWIQTAKQLVSNITDEREKVETLYRYLQKNTRYISIQLGLGGWQPFEASFVAQKGYGDCKALTNYMYSLLKAVGIKAHYTLVYAGEGAQNHLIEDFPSRQFNHAILCVPLQKDTMWLECTSQDAPAGYMGEFTGNRKALLITDQGGVLVSTPKYTLKDNILDRHIAAKLDLDGILNMKVQTRYGGTQQDDLSMMINQLSKDKVQKILQQGLELSTYNVNEFKYEETKSVLPELHEELDITVNGYATISGKRIFIVPDILNRSGRKIDTVQERTVDLVFNSEWRDEDNYDIEIPEGYQLEAAPQNISLKSQFGTYSSSAKIEGNKIIYHRVREQFAGRFPASTQKELAKFYNDIYKADRSRIVLVKKEG